MGGARQRGGWVRWEEGKIAQSRGEANAPSPRPTREGTRCGPPRDEGGRRLPFARLPFGQHEQRGAGLARQLAEIVRSPEGFRPVVRVPAARADQHLAV